MELRCLGEPLLRFRASPLLFLLATPTRKQPTASRQAQVILSSSLNHSHQYFHSTPSHGAQSSSDSMADLDFLDETPKQNSPRPSPDSSSSRRSANHSEIESLLGSTFNVPNPSSRQPYKPPTNSSASMVNASYETSQYYKLRERGARSPGSLSRSMDFPNALGAKTSSDPSSAMSDDRTGREINLMKARRTERSIRSRPSVGRTVEINLERGPDFGRALRILDIQCAVNRVRADQQRQRFHERPGLKKKRLKSERWRKLFRESFRATVGRVKEMRRKGW